ncbi:MAG: galactose mutarotase [Flavobacteriaceae bacterium]|nr:galactose mutarotase [Flavobacteriaceae bacterium]
MKNSDFNTNLNGRKIQLFTLTNSNGVKVEITNFGGKVVSIIVPDRNGVFKDIVLGYDHIDDYISGNPYFGALIGRYGNRIAKGKFSLEGIEYQLVKNNGDNHLHGGITGFNDVVWDANFIDDSEEQYLELEYLSKDGEENYPGNLTVKVIYTLTEENELKISYHATTDKTTIINLTHHSFFNLRGEGNGDILDHELYINSDTFIPTNSESIPTGEIESVEGTPMDFRAFTVIGNRIENNDKQLQFGNGYDHNWVLKNKKNDIILAASAYEPESGRYMEVFTNQPGMQFYSGNFLDGNDVGKGGEKYNQRTAFCLETQHFPDSPNHPNFPSTILESDKKYAYTCIYKFSTK